MSDDAEVIVPGDGTVRVGQMSASDVTALITVFQAMLDRSEQRIIARLDSNAQGAAERWAVHAKEHGAIEARMSKHEGDFESFRLKAIAFYDKYHESEIAEQARIAPVRDAASWLWGNWRTLLLFAVALLAVLSFVGDSLGHLLGIQP